MTLQAWSVRLVSTVPCCASCPLAFAFWQNGRLSVRRRGAQLTRCASAAKLSLQLPLCTPLEPEEVEVEVEVETEVETEMERVVMEADQMERKRPKPVPVHSW